MLTKDRTTRKKGGALPAEKPDTAGVIQPIYTVASVQSGSGSLQQQLPVRISVMQRKVFAEPEDSAPVLIV